MRLLLMCVMLLAGCGVNEIRTAQKTHGIRVEELQCDIEQLQKQIVECDLQIAKLVNAIEAESLLREAASKEALALAADRVQRDAKNRAEENNKRNEESYGVLTPREKKRVDELRLMLSKKSLAELKYDDVRDILMEPMPGILSDDLLQLISDTKQPPPGIWKDAYDQAAKYSLNTIGIAKLIGDYQFAGEFRSFENWTKDKKPFNNLQVVNYRSNLAIRPHLAKYLKDVPPSGLP